MQRRDQFTGSNNLAKPERLPAGAVVDALNVDFTVGGKAELRTGFTSVREQADTRAVFAMGDALALVAGDKLLRVTEQGANELASLSPGPVAAAWHNGELYLNTLAESLRITGNSVMPWAVQAPVFDISIEPGSLPAGVYQIGVTAVQGVESGCLPMVVTLNGSQALRVSVDDDRECILYCSVANGTTLYRQGKAYATNLLSSLVDDTARLATAGLYPLPACTLLDSHQAMLVGARDRFLYHTRPMLPHLHRPESDFVQYPAPISVIASVDSGLYVCADKTYFITGLGSADVIQRTVLDFGAVPGSMASLPDGSVAWFCEYGQVIGRKDGAVELINRAAYAPDRAGIGAAGMLEHNGNQMVITTMRGEPTGSRLRSSDYWDLEVIDNG